MTIRRVRTAPRATTHPAAAPTAAAVAAAAARHFGIYDDAKELLQSADTNGDGLIDYAEFSWLLRNQNENLKHSARAEAKGQLSKFF